MFPILHILTIVLIGLKLTGLVTISWWLVVAPSLIVFAISLLFILLGAFILMRAGR